MISGAFIYSGIDYFSILRSKKVAGSLTEYYYYDNGHLSYITNASNNLKYFFTRDAQGNLLNMIDWTATPRKTYWYVFDAHQSVLGLVDNSGQFVVNYTYNAFGEITGSTGTVTTGDGRLLRDANPFRYASYQYDNESGFYYLKSRYYIPFMGRFLTRDIVPSNNYYVYCGNNPVTRFDPHGLDWEEIWNKTKSIATSAGNTIVNFLRSKKFISELIDLVISSVVGGVIGGGIVSALKKRAVKYGREATKNYLSYQLRRQLSKTSLSLTRQAAIVIATIKIIDFTIGLFSPGEYIFDTYLDKNHDGLLD